MKFTAFGGCADPHAAITALAEDGVEGALYLDANDPQGIGVIAVAEDPGVLRDDAAHAVQPRAVRRFAHKREFDMLGRTYSIGYEPDLEDTLFHRRRAQAARPRRISGRCGIRCSARRNSRRCRPIIRSRSSPSTARSRIATARAATPPTCGSLATVSTRTTTISSSACSAPKLHPLSADRAGDAQDRADLAIPRQLGPVLRRQGRLAEPEAVTTRRAITTRCWSFRSAGPKARPTSTRSSTTCFAACASPPETKAHIAKRYEQFGGVSPINAHTRAFIKALQLELDAHGPALPIYWGNRNWHPLSPTRSRRWRTPACSRALAFVTSTFSSYSGCRRYREDLYEAAQRRPERAAVRQAASALQPSGLHRSRCATASRTRSRSCPPRKRAARAAAVHGAQPAASRWRAAARYEAQLAASCRLVGDALEHQRWRLVYQSNNASYGREPWLGAGHR